MNSWHTARNANARNAREAQPPVCTAVIGAGYWGPNIIRNLHTTPGATVKAVCDIDRAALTKIARRWPSVAFETDVRRVLRDDAIEAVAIATPVGTHAELAEAALLAGKHVFVEKPLASSSSDAMALIALAKQRGLVLMPGHTFLYSPAVTYIRTLIRDGKLGEIQFISMSRLNLGLHQPGVSVIWDLGPHDISILRYWLDEMPARVSAMSRGCVVHDTPDVAFLNLQFGSGTIASIEIGWLSPTKLRRTVIVGSEKMVVYDDTSAEPVRVYDSGVTLPDPANFGEYHLSYRTGDIVSPALDPIEPLYLELEDFCSAVRNGHEPRATAGLGLDVVRVAEAIDRSLDNGGAPVAVAPEITLGASEAQAAC